MGHGSPSSPSRGLSGSQSGGTGAGAGAGFTRRAVAALALGADPMLDPHMPNLSDEDVGKVFKTALEARLRHAIAAETKHRRVRSEQVVPDPTYVQPKSVYARVDSGGMGLIHCVAALGMKWAIPAMTKGGCDVNQPDRRNRTALHWAAAKGHEDTVATLLASGANIRAMARWGAGGYTAADLAAALGHGGIAAYISETSLAASLSNISLYGGAAGSEYHPVASYVLVRSQAPGSAIDRRASVDDAVDAGRRGWGHAAWGHARRGAHREPHGPSQARYQGGSDAFAAPRD